MSNKSQKLVEKLSKFKVLPVITLENAEDILPLANILINNNLPLVEITLRSEESVQAIQLLREKHAEMIIGAGTVLSFDQVKEAQMAGADFIVTPGFNPKVVDFCQEEGLPIIPGANNPMAIEAVLEKGLTAINFFPAEESGGVKMIKALLGPYSQLQLMPTSGITQDNIQDYLEIPQIFTCGCSWFIKEELIKEKKWQEIETLLQQLINI